MLVPPTFLIGGRYWDRASGPCRVKEGVGGWTAAHSDIETLCRAELAWEALHAAPLGRREPRRTAFEPPRPTIRGPGDLLTTAPVTQQPTSRSPYRPPQS